MTVWGGKGRPHQLLSTLGPNGGSGLWVYPIPTAGGVYPAANRALYIPIFVESPVTVYQLAVYPTAQSGNLDIGIYDESSNRLVSAGSTAVGAINTIQAINIADTYLIPGAYFLAINCDNTTAAFLRSNAGNATLYGFWGVQQQAVGAVTLPATATMTSPISSAYIPWISALTMSAVI